MTKQRRIVAGTDLLRELEAAVGTPDAKRRIRDMRKRFGGTDFTERFTPAQKARILAAGAKFVKGWREFNGLMDALDKAGMGTIGRRGRGPRVPEEGEAEHMDAAAKKRIKKVLLGDSSREGLAHINAIPYEMRAVCYKELGLNNLAAEAFRDAAAQLEKRDKPRASVLHEKAGDLFRMCRTGDCCGPLVAPAGSGTVSSTWSAALPEREEHTTGRTMYEEAIREYGLAADLVRKTDTARAEMLGRKISGVQLEMVDEEDGVVLGSFD